MKLLFYQGVFGTIRKEESEYKGELAYVEASYEYRGKTLDELTLAFYQQVAQYKYHHESKVPLDFKASERLSFSKFIEEENAECLMAVS